MADSPKNDDGEASRPAAASEVNADNTASASGKGTEAVQDADKETAPAVATPETPEAEIHKAVSKPRKAPPRKTGPVSKSSGAKLPASADRKSSKNARKPAKAGKTARSAPDKETAPKPEAKASKAAQSEPSVTELKEKIMATQNTPDYTETMSASMSTAVAEMQDRSKAAYEKSTEMMAEMSDFAKGTVEAMVESGKIFSGGMQDMGKTYAEEAKSAYELMTADMKEMAAIKSPTELFQLQGKMMRRNFDAMVATSSKNAEKMMKLSNDAFAPVSTRMNVAAEKMSKVS